MSLAEHFPPVGEPAQRVCPRCGTRPPRGAKKLICSTCVHLCSQCKNLRAPGKRLCHSCASKSMRTTRAQEISLEHRVRTLEMLIVRLRAENELLAARFDELARQVDNFEVLGASLPANTQPA